MENVFPFCWCFHNLPAVKFMFNWRSSSLLLTFSNVRWFLKAEGGLIINFILKKSRNSKNFPKVTSLGATFSLRTAQKNDNHPDVRIRPLSSSSSSPPELSVNTAQFAKSAAMLGNSEDHTALSRALSQLAEVEEKIDQLHQDQANADLYLFSELLGDYVRLIGAVKVRRQRRRGNSLQENLNIYFDSLCFHIRRLNQMSWCYRKNEYLWSSWSPFLWFSQSEPRTMNGASRVAILQMPSDS